MSIHTTVKNAGTPYSDRSAPGAADRAVPERGSDGPFVRIILGSLAAGAVVALLLMLVGFPAGSEARITGSALLGFAAGWSLIWWLIGRHTSAPRQWAAVPAVGFGATGLVLVVAGPGGRGMAALAWVWPPVVAALVVWIWTRIRLELPGRARVVLAPVLGLLLLAAAGSTYQSLEQRSELTTTAPGIRYDVGGRKLHLDCHGAPDVQGTPTVVLLNGLGASSASWARVARGAESARTRVCSYDRAGQGWSDPTTHPQDAVAAARDLHAVLHAAGERGALVLVGHSTGGPYAMTYAHTYPDQVAGMVLLDSSSPEQATRIPGFTAQLAGIRRFLALTPGLHRLGLGHLAAGGSHLPEPDASRVAAVASTPAAATNQHDEQAVILDVFAQAQSLHSLGDRPLVVVTASENAAAPAWAGAQDALARLSENTIHRTVTSSHRGLLEDAAPAEASVDAIRRVVTAVRTGQRLRSVPMTATPLTAADPSGHR